jgi:hypothetical protein
MFLGPLRVLLQVIIVPEALLEEGGKGVVDLG